MRKWWLALFVLAGCDLEEAPGTPTQAGSFLLEARLDPDPPQQRGNSLILTVRDASGNPVDGAQIKVDYTMPAMGSMPEMRGTAEVRAEGSGRYRARFDLPMGGTWTLEIAIQAAQGKADARYTMTVGSPGLTPAGGGVSGVEAKPEDVVVEAPRRQLLGIRTAPVTRGPLVDRIRAYGRIIYDETQLTDIALRVRGWIEKLHASATGRYVRAGEPLFEIYSPELYSAQQELLIATDPVLQESSRRRLLLLGLTEKQVSAVKEAEPTIALLSPVEGYVIEKNVVEGSAVEAGQRLFRIAAIDRVWAEAEIFESDLPRVREDQTVRVIPAYVPGRSYTGRIAYILPGLREETRTARIRVELENPQRELRPDMVVDVELEVALGEVVHVPVEAVLYSGRRRIVFVDVGEGRLRPKEIQVGPRVGERFVVTQGLKEGERVVVSGNFLIASESRLRAATRFWEEP